MGGRKEEEKKREGKKKGGGKRKKGREKKRKRQRKESGSCNDARETTYITCDRAVLSNLFAKVWVFAATGKRRARLHLSSLCVLQTCVVRVVAFSWKCILCGWCLCLSSGGSARGCARCATGNGAL